MQGKLAAIVILCIVCGTSATRLTQRAQHRTLLANGTETTTYAELTEPSSTNICRQNEFIPLPTVWKDGQGYTVASTDASADAYCRARGYYSAGSRREDQRWVAALMETGPSIDLSLTEQPATTDPEAFWITAIECIPEGGEPCMPDEKGNVGVDNRGFSNFGHANLGNGNGGNRNNGDNNYGSDNTGDKWCGYGNTGVQYDGFELEGVGSTTNQLLFVFSDWGDQGVYI